MVVIVIVIVIVVPPHNGRRLKPESSGGELQVNLQQLLQLGLLSLDLPLDLLRRLLHVGILVGRGGGLVVCHPGTILQLLRMLQLADHP